MKKKNLKKLSFSKSAVSNLDKLNGGTPIPAGTNVASGCPVCKPLTNHNCATQNNNCASSVWIACNVSCIIC